MHGLGKFGLPIDKEKWMRFEKENVGKPERGQSAYFILTLVRDSSKMSASMTK